MVGVGAEDGGGGGGVVGEEYRLVFEDRDRIDLGFPHGGGDSSTIGATEVASREMMDGFEEGEAGKWDYYMRACSTFVDCGLPNFIEEELDGGSFPRSLVEATRDWFKVRLCCVFFWGLGVWRVKIGFLCGRCHCTYLLSLFGCSLYTTQKGVVSQPETNSSSLRNWSTLYLLSVVVETDLSPPLVYDEYTMLQLP